MKNSYKIFVIALSLTFALGTGYAMSEKFKDHNEIPEWAQSSVQNLAENGVIRGYENGDFGPNDQVTRAQLATILERYKNNYLIDYSKVLMNYSYFENTTLDYEVKTALALAMNSNSAIENPSSTNNYNLGVSCHFKDSDLQDYGMIKKIISAEIPKSYTVYYCDEDYLYGGGYYVHHNYTGGIPGSGASGTIDRWYGPFAPDFLLSE